MRQIVILAAMLFTSPSLMEASAVIFIDSSDVSQAALVSALNDDLYYSAHLREGLSITVYDINVGNRNDERPFSGAVNYQKDFNGAAVAKMRPGKLPYLFCMDSKEREKREITLTNKEEIKLCMEATGS